MLRDLIKTAALKVANEARRNDDFAKLQFAIWLARRAASVQVPQIAWDTDKLGVVYIAEKKNDAHQLALAANSTY